MSQLTPQVKTDLDHILQEATSAPSALDELALLRTSLRAYQEGRSARDAVAWAAEQLSISLTQYSAHDHR